MVGVDADTGARALPAVPSIAVGGTVVGRLDRVRLLAEQLHGLVSESPERGCRVIRGRDAVLNAWTDTAAGAQQQLRQVGRAPAMSRPSPAPAVRRVVTATACFLIDDERERRRAGDSAAARVDHRVMETLPLRLLICDENTALIGAGETSLDGTEPPGAVLATAPSVILDLAMGFFELLWDIAIPIREDEPMSPDQAILALLAAGLDDRSIGRQLHLSTRTVQRRVHALLCRLHATTRLQAGVRAAKMGWI